MFLAISAAAVLLFGAPSVAAQSVSPDAPGAPAWAPRREVRTGPADLVVTAAALGVMVGASQATPRAEHLRGGVLFDEGARDALRIATPEGRLRARATSDAGLVAALSAPILLDALLVSWAYRGDARLARNLALVGSESLAIAGAFQGITNNLASRERPFARLCGTELDAESPECAGTNRYRSFFSGHSAMSFAGASVLCANHLSLGLLGGPGDALTCAVGFSVATATALLRIAGDMHYASDVAIGAVVGALRGSWSRSCTSAQVRRSRAPVRGPPATSTRQPRAPRPTRASGTKRAP